MSRARGAETAAPCADIAQNHEGSCPATPAFGFVGAHPAAANRVQGMFPNDPVHLGELRRAEFSASRVFSLRLPCCHTTSAFKFIIFQLMQIYEKKQYGQLRTIKNPSLRSFWKRAAGDAAAGSYLWLTPGGYFASAKSK